MNNKKTRNRLFTMLLLVMVWLIPQWGWAQTAIKPQKGDGTPNNPYIIRTAENLAWFREEAYNQIASGNSNISAKIADDVEEIDMSTVCHKADKAKNIKELSWEPIIMFQGTFDGNGKTITNLYVNGSSSVGLFGHVENCTIKNLTIENAYVTNYNEYAGILVGSADRGTILENIKISENCQIQTNKYSDSNGYCTGGIAGYLNGNAYNCVNYANVEGFQCVGGLFGLYYGNSITACANYGKVTADDSNVGGLVGCLSGGTVQDCANYGDVEGEICVGGMAGQVSDGKVKIQNVFCYGNVTGTGNSRTVGIVLGFPPNGAGTEGIVAYYSSAKLTIMNRPQQVKAFGSDNLSEDKATGYTAAQLKSGEVAYLLQKNVSSGAKWGQNLANGGDIYPVIDSDYKVYPNKVTLNCKTNEVVEYSSTYNNTSSVIIYQHINNADGYCTRCQHYVAVKPSQKNGVYQIAKPCHLAWFRDYVNGTIVNDGEAAGTAHPTAAAMLTANIDLKNYCHAADKAQSLNELSWEPIGNSTYNYKGTFDGNGKSISNLYINASKYYVGLFGYINQSTIKDLTFEYAKVTNTGHYTGFLVGRAGNDFSTLQNIKISKTCQIQTKGDKSDYTGGIAGSFWGNAYNCVNYATVRGIEDVAGLFGYYRGDSITACANYGEITATKYYVGGLVGYIYSGTIKNCANYGDVKGLYHVGGMAGRVIEGKLQNVFSYGNVSASDNTQYIGVVFGYSGNGTTEGMVAYYSGAKLTVNKIEKNAKAFGSGDLPEEKATGFSEAQLKSGEVAFKLQQNASSKAKWGQKLANGGDIYPVIGSDYKVYPDKVTLNCKTKEVVEYSSTYNNTSSAIIYQHINNADGYCSRCQPYGVKPSVENGVYQIAKPYHLAWFRNYVNGTIVNDGEADGTDRPSAKLIEDIDLKGYCYAADKTQSLNELSWEPIGNKTNGFEGIFDGNGKTIKNLYIKANQDKIGLFGYAIQCTIKNLTLDNAKVTNTGKSTGLLVGSAIAGNSLQYIKISDNCKLTGGSTYTGGIAGDFVGNVYNCVNYAPVHGEGTYVGGLIGYYRGQYSITAACANYGDVTATSYNVGGLVGYFTAGTIQDCANYGYIEGSSYVGGMAGFVNEGKIQNVFCYGNISAKNNTQRVGMAFGYSNQGGSEGMVAYYSGAKLTVNNGQEQIKTKAFGTGNLPEDKATGFTEAQLKSGEVAWLLNGSTSEGRTLAWYQKLGEKGDKYPVLTPSSGNTVYNNYYTCVDKQVNIYSNTEADTHEKYDKHDKGTETLLENGLYNSTCQRCLSIFSMYIKDFCGIAGNNLELTADAEGNYKAKAVTLTDKAAYNSPVDFTAEQVEYTRNNPHTDWQVYYVPFDIDSRVLTEAGITAAYINNFHEYTKNGETEVVLEVKKVTTGMLKANVPYVIKANQSGETQIQTSNVMLHKAESNKINCQSVTHDYTFTGIYEAQSGFNQEENVNNGIIDYTLKSGLFYELSQTATLNPMRWYLTISNRNKATETPSAQPARVKSVQIKVVGEGEATGIENIHVITDGNTYVNQGIYDLQGRRLSAEPTHGVYIKNGKKIIK